MPEKQTNLHGRCRYLESRYKEICTAFLIDSKDDIKAAEVLLKNSIFSKSVYHSQQAVEKSLKSVLALNGILITDEHNVSDKFSLLFSKFNKVKEVANEAKALERHGSRSRYPLFRDPLKPIWIPSREYKREDAEKALEKAEFVSKKITEFLEEKYNVKI